MKFIPSPRLMSLVTLLTLACVLLPACNSDPAPVARKFDATHVERNEGYALLYSLVGKNQDVDKILSIKSVTPETAAIIKDIASLSKATKEQLDAYAKKDPTLGMADDGLPKFEAESRDAIESTTTKRLLFASGKTFEIRLLQTQTQSMNYLAHLSLLLATNDNDNARADFLRDVSKQAEALFNRVMDRLELAPQASEETPAD